jgi:hypothetical protein
MATTKYYGIRDKDYVSANPNDSCSWYPSKKDARDRMKSLSPSRYELVSQERTDPMLESILPDTPGSIVTGIYSEDRAVFALVEDIPENYWMALTGVESGSTVEPIAILNPKIEWEAPVMEEGPSENASSVRVSGLPTTITSMDQFELGWPVGTIIEDRSHDLLVKTSEPLSSDDGWNYTKIGGKETTSPSPAGTYSLNSYLPYTVVTTPEDYPF